MALSDGNEYFVLQEDVDHGDFVDDNFKSMVLFEFFTEGWAPS